MMPLNFARGVSSVASVPGGTGPHTQATQFVDYGATVNISGVGAMSLEAAFGAYAPTSNTTNFGRVYSAIVDLGYTVLATPKYGMSFEDMPGGSNLFNLNTGGYFKDNVFRFDNYQNSGASYGNHGNSNGAPNWNAPMHLRTLTSYSSTFGHSSFDGHPFLCMSFWSNNTYYGSLTMAFTGYSTGSQVTIQGPSGDGTLLPVGTTRLYDLWYPNQSRSIVVHRREPNSTNNFHTSAQSLLFSSNMQPDAEHGTRSTSKFSQDDGLWGFINGVNAAGGNSGDSFMSNHTSTSYGFANENSGDTSATNFYWGQQYSGHSNYMAFIYTRFV
tara:strand:+ start:847 stop:1830 length:984 start_codon:yes stop_codon:yes gene_type:complete